MLLADGQFRWNRLDNLLREGAKSSDLTADQLWLLAEYVVSARCPKKYSASGRQGRINLNVLEAEPATNGLQC
jgi:hypothetical protein